METPRDQSRWPAALRDLNESDSETGLILSSPGFRAPFAADSANREKHGVGFAAAISVFRIPILITIPDLDQPSPGVKA